ncbi:AraC family transcriptional regulator [Veillonella magna]|uniref:AraC family transcriptional regulator n=1 Tax=Veillonella magna TaxID=464322 RepID=UPI0023EFBD74|nr:AraC family transcriptional regulator [Veillonella magna]MBD8976678.1 AraC family transcriptional regulator [Veillonella magna]
MRYFNYVYTHNHIQMSGYIYRISTYHYNWHPEVEVLIVLQGSVEVCHDGDYTVLDADDCIILSPQCGHATLAMTPDTIALVLHLPPEMMTAYDADFMQYTFCVYSDKNSRYTRPFEAIRRWAAEFMRLGVTAAARHPDRKESRTPKQRELRTGLSPTEAITAEGLIMHVARTVMELVMPVRIRPDGHAPAVAREATFEKMIAYIDANYTSRIELKDIAAIGGYTEGYASQFFKRQLGISFMEYVMRMRLRAAAVALVNSEERIVTIAGECGFTDVKAFNTMFRKHFRTTPSAYRRTARRIARQTALQDWKEYIAADDASVHQVLEQYIRTGLTGYGTVKDKNYSHDRQRCKELEASLADTKATLQQLWQRLEDISKK